MNWLSGAHFLWRDTLLSLDTGGLGLPQLGMPDIVDSLMEAFPTVRTELGNGIGVR